jgi:hypothetical protein
VNQSVCQSAFTSRIDAGKLRSIHATKLSSHRRNELEQRAVLERERSAKSSHLFVLNILRWLRSAKRHAVVNDRECNKGQLQAWPLIADSAAILWFSSAYLQV